MKKVYTANVSAVIIGTSERILVVPFRFINLCMIHAATTITVPLLVLSHAG